MRLALALTLILFGAAATGCDVDVEVELPPSAQAPAAVDAAASEAPETADRLSEMERKLLIAEPAIRLDHGDFDGAVLAFEQMLPAVRDHRRRADMLSSFGVELHKATRGDDALVYLRRAAREAELGWGPDDPELALALADIEQVDFTVNGDRLAPESEAAIERAYAIRLKRLGPKNAETAVTLGWLAQVKGLPSRTQRRPARIAEVDAMFRQSAGMFVGVEDADPMDIQALYLNWIDTLLDNKDPVRARRALDEALIDARLSVAGEQHRSFVRSQAADAFRARGYEAEARAVAGVSPVDDPLSRFLALLGVGRG